MGLTRTDPLTGPDPCAVMGTGTALWWIPSKVTQLFTGGPVSAYMSGHPSNSHGALPGFLVWPSYFVIGTVIPTCAVGGKLSWPWNIVPCVVGGSERRRTFSVVDPSGFRCLSRISFAPCYGKTDNYDQQSRTDIKAVPVQPRKVCPYRQEEDQDQACDPYDHPFSVTPIPVYHFVQIYEEPLELVCKGM